MRLFRYLALCTLLGACSGETLDAGKNEPRDDAGNPSNAVTGVKRDYPPPSNSFRCVEGNEDCWGRPCMGTPSPEVAGSWTGRASFVDATARDILVEITGTGAFEGDDTLCGTVTFGTGAPPPLPESAVEWPPGVPEKAPDGFPLDGFRYEFWTAQRPDVSGAKTHTVLPLYSHQPYKAWCDMQLAFPAEPGTVGALNDPPIYYCLPPLGGGTYVNRPGENCGFDLHSDANGEPKIPLSCAQAILCGPNAICDCDSSGCTVRQDYLSTTADMKADVTFTGEDAEGLLLMRSTTASVTLTRPK